MRRTTLAVAGAVLLAVVGTLLLVSYVKNAEERALEGEELVTVLVVDAPIEEGTDAGSIGSSLREEDVPVKIAAEDSIATVDDLSGRVASVDLVPGEQLIASRFVAEEAYAATTRIEVPYNLLEVTVPLDPARAVGGQLTAGDLVAVIASFDPFTYNAIHPEDVEATFEALELEVVFTGTGIFMVQEFGLGSQEDDFGTDNDDETQRNLATFGVETPRATQIIAHKILVTNIQVEERLVEDETGAARGPDLAPTGNLLVTLAAPAEEIEKIIFTAEHGYLWLAAEDAAAPEPDTDISDRGNVFR